MIRIAITGGIACGKSTVGKTFAGAGIPVCEADLLAHDLMRRGQPVYDEVVEAFGGDILAADGSIARGRMAERVFAESRELETLNNIVHPAVRRAWEDWLSGCPADVPAVAVIIPLFNEIGEGAGWDVVIAVIASEVIQVERLAGRGLSEEEARARMRAQMPLTEKARRADFVIVNEGSEEILIQQTERVLQSILENSTYARES